MVRIEKRESHKDCGFAIDSKDTLAVAFFFGALSKNIKDSIFYQLFYRFHLTCLPSMSLQI